MRLFQFVRVFQELKIEVENLLLGTMAMHSLEYNGANTKFLLMIKQSFLRNYNVSKIYSQAEDQKKRLQVFYIRQVNRLVRDKRHEHRDQTNNKLRQKNREEKQEISRLVEIIGAQTEKYNKTLVRRNRKIKKNNTEQSAQEDESKPKAKADLFVSTLQLAHHYSTNFLSSKGMASYSKKFRGKAFVPKYNSSSVSFRPPWEQLPAANCPNISERHASKQKLITSPSFYEHFQNVKLKQYQRKETSSNILQAVKKRLKREQQLKQFKVQLNDSQKQNRMEGCESKESLLSPFAMFSPKSIGSSLASLNQRQQCRQQV